VDDELLRALGREHRRAEREADAAMAEGTDTTAEPAFETDFFRPLSADERASVLDAAFERIDAEQAGSSVEPAARASGRGRTIAVIGAALAMAAALVLWIARPQAPSGTLPGYTLTTLRGGTSDVRSDPTQVNRELVLQGDRPIEAVLTPSKSIDGELAVTVVARSTDGRRVFAPVDAAEISENGAVRLKGPLSRFARLEPGDWEVTLVVSPAGDRPEDAEVALSDPTLQRETFRVRLTASP